MTEAEHQNEPGILPTFFLSLTITQKDEEQKHIDDLIKNGVEEGMQVTF